jgi:hypothetical protein
MLPKALQFQPSETAALGLRDFSLSNRRARLSSQILCEGLIELEEQLALRDALIAFETLN